MRLLLLTLILVSGCAMPETARAAKQADQAVEGIGLVVFDIVPVVSAIKDDEQRTKIKSAFLKIIDLTQSARISLSPTLAYLGEGKEIKVETTAKEAAKTPKSFCVKAGIQAGKATAEVQASQMWSDLFIEFFDPSNLEGLLVGISTALFGTGTAGLIAVKVLRTINTHKAALVDQIAYTKKRQEISDPSEIASLKEAHTHRQKVRGTKSIIDDALQKVKDGTHT